MNLGTSERRNGVMQEMLGKFYKNWLPAGMRRRKRDLDKIREQLEIYGYSVEDLTDQELAAAVTDRRGRIDSEMPLTAKRTYWIVRRLSDHEPRSAGRRSSNGTHRRAS